MADFLIVMRGAHKAFTSIPADEKQRLMERYSSFVAELRSKGRFKTGSALKGGAIELKPVKGQVVIDGPFPETKEALNGYFLFEAPSRDEAVEIAKQCPALLHGETVELHELTSH